MELFEAAQEAHAACLKSKGRRASRESSSSSHDITAYYHAEDAAKKVLRAAYPKVEKAPARKKRSGAPSAYNQFVKDTMADPAFQRRLRGNTKATRKAMRQMHLEVLEQRVVQLERVVEEMQKRVKEMVEVRGGQPWSYDDWLQKFFPLDGNRAAVR